jgi:hypothetical protein
MTRLKVTCYNVKLAGLWFFVKNSNFYISYFYKSYQLIYSYFRDHFYIYIFIFIGVYSSARRPFKVLQMIESNNYVINLPLNFDISSIHLIRRISLYIKHNSLSLIFLLKPLPHYPYLWHQINILMLLWMYKLFLSGMVNFSKS